MFRNCLMAALRDLARSPVLSFIAIGGLAIGLAAAILAGSVIANQLDYDGFIPGHERTYFATVEFLFQSRAPVYLDETPHDLAAHLKQNFSEIEAVSRIEPATHALRHGTVEAQETVYEADPNIFQVMPLPVLHGELDKALQNPDSIVIPQAVAEKYFGRDDVVGETIELDRQHPVKISAVIADLPENASNLRTAIFVSGRTSYASIRAADDGPANGQVSGNFIVDTQTLVRFKPGVSVERLQRRMSTMGGTLLPAPKSIVANVDLVRLDRFHLSPRLFPGAGSRVSVLGVVALLILFLAIVNFVNLSVARSTRRSLEVGIRKAAGAGRGALMVQFLGETVLHAMLALCIAVMLAELSLPVVNAFLNSGAVLDYGGNPLLAPALILGALVTGIAAGAYPALILSSFRPATVLNGLVQASSHAGMVRQILVGLQFTILTVLVIAAGVVFEQYRFATGESLQLKTDQMMFVRVPKCDDSFKTEIVALPGVRGAACSEAGLLNTDGIHGNTTLRDGTLLSVRRIMVGPGMMELYGLKPVAGRFLDEKRPGDIIPPKAPKDYAVRMVLNETAVRLLGFTSAQAAIGKAVAVTPYRGFAIGVVKDFGLNSSGAAIEPTIYFARAEALNPEPGPRLHVLLHVKLDGHAIAPTLASIDGYWNRTAASGPIQRTFMSAYVENLWLSLLREGQAFSAFAGVAVLLACLGLFGLSLSSAQRRTREIGIRKAMGATSAQIVALLLWQFSKPVMWANLVAWPLAFWAMNRWLAGFANHVTLSWWLFPAASIVTLLIALITMSGHAVLVARQKPVLALRYE